MALRLNDAEVKLLHYLAALSVGGMPYGNEGPSLYGPSGLTAEQFGPAFETLEALGCVKVTPHTGGTSIEVLPEAAMLSRRVKEEEREAARPKDLLEAATTWALGHRFVGPIIFVFVVFGAILAVAGLVAAIFKSIAIKE